MIWIVALLMIVVVLVVILMPLWRRGGAAQQVLDSDTANIAVLKEQLAELEQELAAGNLTAQQHEQASADLQRAVAADLSGEATQASASTPLSGQSRRWFSLLLIIILPLSSFLLYKQVSSYRDISPTQLAGASAKTDMPPQSELPPLTELVEVLAARLRAEPDNQEGWKMLGKTYMLLQRAPEAVAAFEQSYQRGGNKDAGLLVDYAEALAYANDNLMQGKPHTILKEALQIQPDLSKALWLSGFAWFQQEDYAQAVKNWESVVHSSDLDPGARQVLQQYLGEARKLAGMPAVAATAGQEASVSVQIAVHVTLDAALRDQVKPDDVVFVFAKLAKGMPVPLAVRKIKVNDLPTTVVLDDSMSMLEGHSLAGKSEVLIGSRVSKSGAPIPQPGDLQGLSAVIDPQTTPEISIKMDQVVK